MKQKTWSYFFEQITVKLGSIKFNMKESIIDGEECKLYFRAKDGSGDGNIDVLNETLTIHQEIDEAKSATYHFWEETQE